MLVSPNFVIQFDFPKDLGFDHDRIFNGDANALGQLHYVEQLEEAVMPSGKEKERRSLHFLISGVLLIFTYAYYNLT